MHLFKLYNSLCPPQRPKGEFYLQPLSKPELNCWFSTKPIGRNTLDGTVEGYVRRQTFQGIEQTIPYVLQLQQDCIKQVWMNNL